MQLDDLVLVACYILYHSKRWTDGCGGNTDILVSSVKHSFFGSPLSTGAIRQLEDLFKAFDEQISYVLVKFANKDVSPSEFGKAMHDLKQRLVGIRNRSNQKDRREIEVSFAELKKSLSNEPPNSSRSD